MTSDDVLFLAAPLTFDPSIIDIFLSLSSAAKLIIVPHKLKIQPMKLSKILHDFYHVTILQVTPSLMFSFGAKLLKETILSNSSCLKILAMGGEQFPPLKVIKSWRANENKATFYNLYGLTEVSCWSSCYKVTEEDFCLDVDVPIGKAMKDTSLVVIDENGQNINNGFGWLYTGGPQRICKINGCKPLDCLRNTGDWVRVDDLGRIFYLHRKDDQIKRFGKRLNLQEIDSIILKKLPFIDNCKALVSNGRLIIFYKISEEEMSINKTSADVTIKETLKSFLPSYYQPDYLVRVDLFPLDHHGKQNIPSLLEKLKENMVNDHSLEEIFKKSWKISLNLPEDISIDPSTTFVSAGGNSIMAMHFIGQLQLSLEIELTPLIHSVFHSSYAETLHTLEKLIYKQNKKNLKGEITKKEEESSTMEQWNDESLKEDSIQKEKSHFDNEILFNSSQSVKADSLKNSEQIRLNNKKEASVSGKMVFPKSTTLCDKRDMFENEDQIPTKLFKKEKLKDESGVLDADQDYHSIDNSQATCNHKKKMVEILWTFNTGKCVDASPVISLSGDDEDAVIFIGSHSHRFYALLSKNGKMLWEAVLGDRIESSACISLCQKYVTVGCYDAHVYTLKVETGEIYWKFKTGDTVKSSPRVDPLTSFIWVGSHDECIYCLDIKSKSNKVKKNLQSGSIFSSPAICNSPHQVYISTLGGYLYSLNPFNGNTKWKQNFGKPLFTSPCIASNGVVVGCVDGGLYSLNHDGSQVWKLDTNGQIFSSPISLFSNQDNEIIVCGSFSHFVFCCFTNGYVKWKTNVHYKIYASPCSNFKFQDNFQTSISKDEHKREFSHEANQSQNKCYNKLFIAVCATDGNLQILCENCGFVLTNYKLPGEVFSSPILCGKKIFIGCRDDKIYCLKFEDL